MRAIIATGIFLSCSLACLRDENFDREYRRQTHSSFQVTDVFGAAQLIKHLLKHSQDLKELFKDPMDILRATMIVGGIAAVVKVSLMGAQAIGMKIPEVAAKIYKRSISWWMRKLGWPEGFDHEQLLTWETVFEHMMITLCGGSIRAEQSKELRPDYWYYYRDSVIDMMIYMQDYLLTHRRYYRAKQLQDKREAVLGMRTVEDNNDHICFMVDVIVRSLGHIVNMCKDTNSSQEVDVVHIKKIGGNVLVLCKQVRLMIHGGTRQWQHQHEYYDFMEQPWLPSIDYTNQI